MFFFFSFLNCTLKQANPTFKLRKHRLLGEMYNVSKSIKTIMYNNVYSSFSLLIFVVVCLAKH